MSLLRCKHQRLNPQIPPNNHFWFTSFTFSLNNKRSRRRNSLHLMRNRLARFACL